MSEDRPAEEQTRSDRRSFLKRLTGEAVQAAATIAGSTGIVVRSANAAGEAAAAELGLAGSEAEAATRAAPPAPTPSARAVTAAPAAPTSPPAPLRPLTPRETELLSSATAVIAANGADGVPHLTRAPFHWDGEVGRSLGQLFGARIGNVQRDPRISVLVEDGRGWVTLIGEATVVTGPAAIGEATPLLARDHPGQPPDAAWAALCAAGDQAVIVLRPTRIVSQPG